MKLDTAMDRYIDLADLAPRDPTAVDRLIDLFADNASVRLAEETVTGRGH
jgi:hypothetical protein